MVSNMLIMSIKPWRPRWEKFSFLLCHRRRSCDALELGRRRRLPRRRQVDRLRRNPNLSWAARRAVFFNRVAAFYKRKLSVCIHWDRLEGSRIKRWIHMHQNSRSFQQNINLSHRSSQISMANLPTGLKRGWLGLDSFLVSLMHQQFLNYFGLSAFELFWFIGIWYLDQSPLWHGYTPWF